MPPVSKVVRREQGYRAVRTNVGYKPVAEFICESETTNSITEALELLKEWNPEWRSRYFMTDYR